MKLRKVSFAFEAEQLMNVASGALDANQMSVYVAVTPHKKKKKNAKVDAPAAAQVFCPLACVFP